MRIAMQPDLPPQLSSARLLLREVGLEDISQELLTWLNDPGITEFLEIRHAPQTPERVLGYVKERLAHPESPHFGIYDKDGTRLVGTVTVNALNNVHQTADISFVIGHPGAICKGYAAEAVHAVCAYLFAATDLYKITGGHYCGNIGSLKVFEKNGFTQEGIRREQCVTVSGKRTDVILHGLLRSEFIPNAEYLGGEIVIVRPEPH